MTTSQPPADAGRGPAAGLAAREARILVAEDDNTFRHVLEMLLGEHWNVEAFADGRKVLDAARKGTPDLVLADLLMAGLDGFGLVRELRADAATRAVPVIVITGLTEEEARIKALEAWTQSEIVWLDELYDLTDHFPDPSQVFLMHFTGVPIQRAANARDRCRHKDRRPDCSGR